MIIKSGFTMLSITKNTTESLNIYILIDYAIIRSFMRYNSESVMFFVILNLVNHDFITSIQRNKYMFNLQRRIIQVFLII
jgi:hypothetical protein